MNELTQGIWDIGREPYHADTSCVSHSAMKDFRDSVPLFAGKWITKTVPWDEPTPAMALGTAVHTLALEPHKFQDEIAVKPEGIDRRTNAGKAAWADFCIKAGRKLIIDQDQYDNARRMADAVRSHAIAGKLVDCDGQAELPIRWQDKESGLWVRNLLDRWIPSQGIVIDLKTSADVTPGAFARSVANFQYHCQAALYRRGAEIVFDQTVSVDFVFIVVGNAEPFEVACYVLDGEALDIGERLNQAALNEIAERKKANDWTSRYAAKLQTLTLPKYATYI